MTDNINELMFALGRLDAHFETLQRLWDEVDKAKVKVEDERQAECGAEVKDMRGKVNADDLPF